MCLCLFNLFGLMPMLFLLGCGLFWFWFVICLLLVFVVYGGALANWFNSVVVLWFLLKCLLCVVVLLVTAGRFSWVWWLMFCCGWLQCVVTLIVLLLVYYKFVYSLLPFSVLGYLCRVGCDLLVGCCVFIDLLCRWA